MADQDEKIETPKQGGNILDISDMSTIPTSLEEDLTTLFAVRTTINQESNILKQIFYRFRILDSIPDIKAMLVSSLLPGYIFIEASQKRDVQIAIQGIPHIKGRIVGQIKLKEINHVLVPRSVTEFLGKGDTVEIIGGIFEGSRALVIRMPHDTSSSEEVVIRLLQEETPITIKIHGDYLKLVEKKKREDEAVPEVKAAISEELIGADLDKMITFDDDLGEFEDSGKEEAEEYATSEYVSYEEDDEFDQDDEWAKFDGF